MLLVIGMVLLVAGWGWLIARILEYLFKPRAYSKSRIIIDLLLWSGVDYLVCLIIEIKHLNPILGNLTLILLCIVMVTGICNRWVIKNAIRA